MCIVLKNVDVLSVARREICQEKSTGIYILNKLPSDIGWQWRCGFVILQSIWYYTKKWVHEAFSET